MAKPTATEPRVQTGTSVSVPTWEKLSQMARQEGVSRSEIQRRAIERFVKDSGKEAGS